MIIIDLRNIVGNLFLLATPISWFHWTYPKYLHLSYRHQAICMFVVIQSVWGALSITEFCRLYLQLILSFTRGLWIYVPHNFMHNGNVNKLHLHQKFNYIQRKNMNIILWLYSRPSANTLYCYILWCQCI